MGKKEYSRLGEIPRGSAGETLTQGCLVLEGGAFRGLYTQGFLDAMMTQGLNLRCVIGVSAGALGGLNYAAGQIGRSARINLGYRHDSRYVGLRALVHSGSFLDVGFLTEERGILEPLDRARLADPLRRFVAVTTDCRSGKAAYFEKGKCADLMLAVRASATMPFISPPVMIDGAPHLDGGCACKIPYGWAMEQGYEKIVVIRTRDPAFRKPEKELSAALRFYRKYPAFARALADSDRAYNRQCDEIEALHARGRLLRLAPSEPVTVSRLEKDLEKLGDLYFLGWKDGMDNLASLRAYLEA